MKYLINFLSPDNITDFEAALAAVGEINDIINEDDASKEILILWNQGLTAEQSALLVKIKENFPAIAILLKIRVADFNAELMIPIHPRYITIRDWDTLIDEMISVYSIMDVFKETSAIIHLNTYGGESLDAALEKMNEKGITDWKMTTRTPDEETSSKIGESVRKSKLSYNSHIDSEDERTFYISPEGQVLDEVSDFHLGVQTTSGMGRKTANICEMSEEHQDEKYNAHYQFAKRVQDISEALA